MATRTLNIPAFLSDTPQPVIGPVVLSGARYTLRLFWSPLATLTGGLWVSDLAAASGAIVAPCVPLTLTDDLWALYKDSSSVPQGALEVVRLSGEGDPGIYDLGVSVELRYTD